MKASGGTQEDTVHRPDEMPLVSHEGLAMQATLAGDEAAGLMRRATYASVAVALALVAMKLLAWLETSSVALLSSLVDSVLDAGASLINMFAVRHALTPADREHRFGHGKAEALAGLGQGAVISGSGFFVTYEAIDRMISPAPVAEAGLGVGVMVVSILLTGLLVFYQRRVVRRTQSVAVTADSLHYVGDLLQNAGVILAIVLAGSFGIPAADPAIALVIALVILYAAWQVMRTAFSVLMDRELSDADRAFIREIVLSHPEVRDMHDLRTRRSGADYFIQLHLELDGGMTLDHAHRISDQVEDRILEIFPNAEVLIHQDPEGVVERRPDLRFRR